MIDCEWRCIKDYGRGASTKIKLKLCGTKLWVCELCQEEFSPRDYTILEEDSPLHPKCTKCNYPTLDLKKHGDKKLCKHCHPFIDPSPEWHEDYFIWEYYNKGENNDN